MKTIQKVGCAVIPDKKRVLITQRKPGDSCAGFWEFPGGTLQEGESLEACLVREVMEELRMRIRPLHGFQTRILELPQKILELNYVLCQWLGGNPVAIDCFQFRWIPVKDLIRAPMLAEDIQVARWLVPRPSVWEIRAPGRIFL
ncbi:MAG: (deoxy)nucleoside triphosphate pyrophosphohydrolase [Candidatus Omnitrophota bacterium]